MKSLFLSVCAAAVLNVPGWAQMQWLSETISIEPGLWEASIALDAGNNPSVSYRLYHVINGRVQYDRMVYSSRSTQGWDHSVFDSDGGAYECLKIDSQGMPHISYYDKQSENLAYVHRNGSQWQKEIIDSYGSVGGFTSLALDASDRAHISYITWASYPYKINYANNTGLSWSLQTFAGWSGRTSITLDAAGNPHIAAGSKYGYWNGSSWQISSYTASSGIGEVSIELDSAGRPHIAYSDGSVKYAYWDGTTWHNSTIGGGFTEVSLELDSLDKPHIMFGNCRYAALTSSGWNISTLAAGTFEDFVLDSSDLAHFVYTTNFNDLIYMHQVPEPGTLGLLAVGGLALVRKRRK